MDNSLVNKGQSKYYSFLEAVINSIIGYAVAIFSQEVLFPHYGIKIPLASHLQLGLWFTIISIARSFILRRIFNWVHYVGSDKSI